MCMTFIYEPTFSEMGRVVCDESHAVINMILVPDEHAVEVNDALINGLLPDWPPPADPAGYADRFTPAEHGLSLDGLEGSLAGSARTGLSLAETKTPQKPALRASPQGHTVAEANGREPLPLDD